MYISIQPSAIVQIQERDDTRKRKENGRNRPKHHSCHTTVIPLRRIFATIDWDGNYMDRLGRYPLSVILSFLTETEGCSLLITRRKWALQLLPIFRLPSIVRNAQHRHRFRVVPVQDAATRLDRLNTRRWKKRRIGKLRNNNSNKTTNQVAQEEWEHRVTVFPPLLRFGKNDNAFQPGITLLVSYPRSGNTFLRSLLESITGVVTNSDTRPDRTLSLALANQYDLVGEGLCRPPICKTHWPERIGCQRYVAKRAVLVVRNPWDAIDSYWNLNLTNTHTEKVTEEVYERFQDFFHDLVINEMQVWLDFHQFWCSVQIPLLISRYEDLINEPRSELKKILEFYTASPDILHSLEPRLDSVLRQGSHGYQPKSSSSSSTIGRSIRRGRYPPELVSKLQQMDNHGWLQKFGYQVQEQNFPNNLDSLPPITQANNFDIEASLVINQREIDLRPPNCPYGRNMRAWRRRYTVDDTKPFPTVLRKKNKDVN